MSFERAIGPLLVVLVLLAAMATFMWAVVRFSKRVPAFNPNPRSQRRLAWFQLAVSAMWLASVVAFALVEGEVRLFYLLLAAMFVVTGLIQIRESDARRIEQRKAAGPGRLERYFDRHPLRLAAVLMLAIVAGLMFVALLFVVDAANWRA